MQSSKLDKELEDDYSYQGVYGNKKFMSDYEEYQKKYAKHLRESDKKIIEVVTKIIDSSFNGKENISLLDVGCSSGNLLMHLKNHLPNINFTGYDMATETIETCKNNTELDGIDFDEVDILNPPVDKKFDIIIESASLSLFADQEYEKAVKQVHSLLNDNGWFVAFDWFHPYEQEIAIIEKISTNPDGMKFYFHSYKKISGWLNEVGFINTEFEPFYIPIDLPKPEDSKIVSYTVRTEDEKNLSFRGCLNQPWCILTTQRN